MLKSIIEYIGGLHHTVKKDSVSKSLDFIMANINNDVIPALEVVIDNGNLSNIETSSLLTTLGRSSNIKYKDNRDILVKIKGGFVNISKSYNTLSDLVEKELNDIITDKTITAKDAAILRIINDIGSMNSFILDFVYLILVDEKNTDLPKVKLKQIRDNVSTFASAYRVYGDNFNKLLQDTYKISTNTIDINEGKESMISVMLAKSGKIVNLPTASGFITNPIYHIRLWLVDKEIKKYESLKDKKRLIELKVMELKLEQNNESDPKLVKQIEYYENKLSRVEYEIEKIEQN